MIEETRELVQITVKWVYEALIGIEQNNYVYRVLFWNAWLAFHVLLE